MATVLLFGSQRLHAAQDDICICWRRLPFHHQVPGRSRLSKICVAQVAGSSLFEAEITGPTDGLCADDHVIQHFGFAKVGSLRKVCELNDYPLRLEMDHPRDGCVMWIDLLAAQRPHSLGLVRIISRCT
jgi:hypothetical protein